jgi:Zn-dependent hydrolases, including glyoxylases
MKQEIIRMDLGSVNCYLGKEGNSFILFDTGGHTFFDKSFTDRCDDLEKELNKYGCYPGNLNLIVLTHGDNDHVANAAYIKDKFNSKIAMHSSDIALVDNPSLKKVMENCNYSSPVYKIIFALMKNKIEKLSQKFLNDFKSFKPDIIIDEGSSLLEYGFDAKILHLPGHTLGSIGILTKDGDLIVGDTLTNLKKPAPAPNASDFKTLKASISKLKSMKIRTVYPGHGSPFEMK